MKKLLISLLCLPLVYISVFGAGALADGTLTVRVGIYNNQPKIFIDDEGNPSGFWVDIIEYVSAEERWEIEYIHGTWSQCLSRLENNEIDMMPDVAYTEERSRLYDFSSEAVYTSWSGVYTRESVDIQSILDLEGKNIAVLEGSVNVDGPEGIKTLVREFSVDCTFTEADSYIGVFELVNSGEADAGVVSKDFGYQNEKQFDLVRTPIIFQPSVLYFAFPKESSLSPYLTEIIDYRMKELKGAENSIYYKSLEYWLGAKPVEKSVIPGWLTWLLVGIGGLALLLIAGSFILRSQVRSRTKELTKEKDERVQVEKELDESEDKYRNLVELATDGICIIQEGIIKYANPRQAEMWGGPVDELIDKPFVDYIPADYLPVITDRYNRRMAGEEVPSIYDAALKRKDGSDIYVELNVGIINYLGKPAELVMIRDISERMRMEAAIKESEEKFSEIFYANPNSMIIVAPDTGAINDVNETFLQSGGFEREECIGNTITGLGLWVSEEDRKKFIRILSEEDKIQDFETEIHLKSGEIRSVLLSVETITIAGKPYRVISSNDITERKNMQEQLIVTDRLSSIGELASGIAHELNNPLTGVIGFSDLLLANQDTPEAIKEDLTIINKEALRASQVARHLLTFARKHPDEKQPTDINRIIRGVVELREYEQKVSNIEVDARLQADLPSVLANDFQLQQVFLNIIINAEHFMIEEHGRGVMSITTERDGDIVRVTFTDDGPGIPPEHLGHIFDPFYTTKEIGKGTGLGLSICYGIITEHGGKIYVESELGKGAAFTIELPVLGDS